MKGMYHDIFHVRTYSHTDIVVLHINEEVFGNLQFLSFSRTISQNNICRLTFLNKNYWFYSKVHLCASTFNVTEQCLCYLRVVVCSLFTSLT
jgi:hypothetical protein